MRILVILLLLAAQLLPAQNKAKQTWHKIGEASLDFKKETAEVPATEVMRVDWVKLKVSNATINVESFDIHFDSGEMQRVDIHQLVKSDSETNAVNLNGRKTVKKIALRYKNIGFNSDIKPLVEIWGI